MTNSYHLPFHFRVRQIPTYANYFTYTSHKSCWDYFFFQDGQNSELYAFRRTNFTVYPPSPRTDASAYSTYIRLYRKVDLLSRTEKRYLWLAEMNFRNCLSIIYMYTQRLAASNSKPTSVDFPKPIPQLALTFGELFVG